MKLSGAELKNAIEGSVKGDSRSQELIFRTYYGKMMGVTMRYAKDENLAKDLVQESFIKVFEKVRVYNHQGSFEGWIRRIVVNTAIDHFRKKKKELLVLDEDDSYDGKYGLQTEEDVDDGFYASIKPEMVIKALAQLSPAYKLVFNMYVVEGYSHKEIAEELDINIGTSKSNLAKAKQKLKKILLNNINQTNE